MKEWTIQISKGRTSVGCTAGPRVVVTVISSRTDSQSADGLSSMTRVLLVLCVRIQDGCCLVVQTVHSERLENIPGGFHIPKLSSPKQVGSQEHRGSLIMGVVVGKRLSPAICPSDRSWSWMEIRC